MSDKPAHIEAADAALEDRNAMAAIGKHLADFRPSPEQVALIDRIEKLFEQCGWNFSREAMTEMVALHGNESMKGLIDVAEGFRDRMSYKGDVYEYLKGKTFPLDGEPQTITVAGKKALVVGLNIEAPRDPGGRGKLTVEYIEVTR